MTDFETRLVAERERLTWPIHNERNNTLKGFDAAATIAREVVAEKDAEIANGWAECVEIIADKDAEIANLRAEINAMKPALKLAKGLLEQKDAEKDAEIVKWRTWATEMPDYGWELDDRDSPLWRWFDDMPKDTASAAAEQAMSDMRECDGAQLARCDTCGHALMGHRKNFPLPCDVKECRCEGFMHDGKPGADGA